MKTRKTITILLSASMLASCLCGCGSTAATVQTVPAAAEEAPAATVLNATGSVLAKDETVYVLCAADGNVDKIIVSDWLKNGDREQAITDPTTLRDVTVVKGDTSYSLDGDKQQVWDAKGGDVYYQGTSQEKLPVDVRVSFRLDGKSISAEELAGKSGHVSMRFDYQNNDTEPTTVGDEKMNLYVPYLMLSGMILPEGFTNVEITNGKVIDTGSMTVAMGYALPGMQDNLRDLDEKIDLPDYVELSADVENFSLSMTLTLAMRDALKDLNLDSVDSLDELEDSMTELDDAAKQLLDGTDELADGLQTLFDSCGDLTGGVDELYDGGSTLKDGAAEIRDNLATLSDGASDLQEGAGKLDDGLGTLLSSAGDMKQGVGKLDDGASELYDGLKTLNGKVTSELVPGIEQLDDGANKLDAGLGSLAAKVPTLTAGVRALVTGVNDPNQGLAAGAASLKAGAATVAAGAQAVSDGVDLMHAEIAKLDSASLSQAASGISTGAAGLETGVNAVSGYVDAGISDSQSAMAQLQQLAEENPDIDFSAAISALADAMQAQGTAQYILTDGDTPLTSGAATLATSTATLNAAVNGTSENPGLLAELAQLSGGIDQLYAGCHGDGTAQNPGLVAGSAAVAAGADALNTGVGTLQAGVTTLNLGVNGDGTAENPGLAAGVQQLADGSAILVAGTGKLSGSTGTLTDGVSDLLTGSGKLSDGTSELRSGSQELIDGVGKLKDGSSELYDGTITLKDGSGKLFDGSVTLADGAGTLLSGIGTLKTGTSDLTDGVSQLRDGGKELDEGMNKFYDEGISKIMETLNDKLPDLLNRFRALCDLASESATFTGLSDDMQGSVKYIYRTDSIGE